MGLNKVRELTKERCRSLMEGPLEKCLPQFVHSALAQGSSVPRSIRNKAEMIRNRPGYRPIVPYSGFTG